MKKILLIIILGMWLVQARGVEAGYTLVKTKSGTGGAEVMVKGVGAGLFDENKLKVWHYDKFNPIIVPKSGGPYPNIYGANLVNNGVWNLYYGGWDGTADLHDRIYLGVSSEGLHSQNWGPRPVVVDHGDCELINDPSVVKDGANWYMAYTCAFLLNNGCTGNGGVYGNIGITHSSDGVVWSPNVGRIADMIVLHDVPAQYHGLETNINRPSLTKNGNEWWLYFDGGGRCDPNVENYDNTFLATSTDLKNFYFRGNALSSRFSIEPDVKKLNGKYVLVNVWFSNGIFAAVSDDGQTFRDLGNIIKRSGQIYDSYAISNPGMVTDGNRLLGVWYGAHQDVGEAVASFMHTGIAASYLQKAVTFSNALNLAGYNYAYGPEVLSVVLPAGLTEMTGTWSIKDTDGTSLLYQSGTVTIKGGDEYALQWQANTFGEWFKGWVSNLTTMSDLKVLLNKL